MQTDEQLNNKWSADTLPPGKDLIFQINASSSGTYDADPIDVRTSGLEASDDTGNSISTFVAVLYNSIIFPLVKRILNINLFKIWSNKS